MTKTNLSPVAYPHDFVPWEAEEEAEDLLTHGLNSYDAELWAEVPEPLRQHIVQRVFDMNLQLHSVVSDWTDSAHRLGREFERDALASRMRSVLAVSRLNDLPHGTAVLARFEKLERAINPKESTDG